MAPVTKMILDDMAWSPSSAEMKYADIEFLGY